MDLEFLILLIFMGAVSGLCAIGTVVDRRTDR